MEPDTRLEEYCRQALVDMGLTPYESRQVLDLAKNARQARDFRWNYPATFMMSSERNAVLETIKNVAAQWLEKNRPQHPARTKLKLADKSRPKTPAPPPAETPPPPANTAPQTPLKIKGRLTTTFGDNARCYAVTIPDDYDPTDLMTKITERLQIFQMHAEFPKDADGEAVINEDGTCTFVVENERQPDYALHIILGQGLTCTLESSTGIKLG